MTWDFLLVIHLNIFGLFSTLALYKDDSLYIWLCDTENYQFIPTTNPG